MHSSTSSSEGTYPGVGRPWAVVAAVLVVFAVEMVVRLTPTHLLLGYGEGLGSYYEVVHTIDEYGAAEVAILGSSRGRESVVMPMFDAYLDSALGRDVYTANYSCPDARTSEMLLVTRKLMSAPVPPKVVLYVISPRAFHGDERSSQREEIFGVFPDQYGQDAAHLLASFSERPLWQLRNMLQENYMTFRYRYRIRNLLASLPRGRMPTSPTQGGYTPWQVYVRDRSLETHPISERQIRDYVSRLLDANGRYVLGAGRVADLEEIARICRAAGTELILVTAPISADLARHFPPGVLDEYDAILGRVAAAAGSRVLGPADLGLAFGPAEFREQSHLNRRGAEKLTKALVADVVQPTLSR